MLIDERLYLPQKWIDDKARCLKAKIPPEEIKFRTKHEPGLEMIDNAIEEGMALRYFEWVTHIHLLNVKVTCLKFRNIFS